MIVRSTPAATVRARAFAAKNANAPIITINKQYMGMDNSMRAPIWVNNMRWLLSPPQGSHKAIANRMSYFPQLICIVHAQRPVEARDRFLQDSRPAPKLIRP